MPKIIDHDKYKNELLIKCFDLFALKGYAEVTMRQIATELKISTGSLYHYFPTKQNMLDEMFKRLSRIEIKNAAETLNNVEYLEERISLLNVYFKKREDFLSKFLLLTIDYYRHYKDKKNRLFIKEFLEHVVNEIADNLKIDKLSAKQIFIFYSGFIYNRLIFGDDSNYDTQTSFYSKMIIDAIEKNNN